METFDALSLLGGAGIETILAIISTYIIGVGIIYILYLVGLWKVFTKCGKSGWISLIPVYNVWVLFEIVGIPGWLSIVPVANGIGVIYANYKLGEKFGKSVLFSLGLVFFTPIFILILAFSSKANFNQEEGNNPLSDLNDKNLQTIDNSLKNQSVGSPEFLMATPAVSAETEVPLVEKSNEFEELPSLEVQMNSSAVAPEPILATPVNEVISENEILVKPEGMIESPVNKSQLQNNSLESNINAFEIPMLVQDTPPATPNIDNLELNKEPEVLLVEENMPIENNIEVVDNIEPVINEATTNIKNSDIPVLEPPVVNPEVVSTSNFNFQQTQKFCPQCGNPNDVLSKFCVSCGHKF